MPAGLKSSSWSKNAAFPSKEPVVTLDKSRSFPSELSKPNRSRESKNKNIHLPILHPSDVYPQTPDRAQQWRLPSPALTEKTRYVLKMPPRRPENTGLKDLAAVPDTELGRRMPFPVAKHHSPWKDTATSSIGCSSIKRFSRQLSQSFAHRAATLGSVH